MPPPPLVEAAVAARFFAPGPHDGLEAVDDTPAADAEGASSVTVEEDEDVLEIEEAGVLDVCKTVSPAGARDDASGL